MEKYTITVKSLKINTTQIRSEKIWILNKYQKFYRPKYRKQSTSMSSKKRIKHSTENKRITIETHLQKFKLFQVKWLEKKERQEIYLSYYY